jgi:RND family efflux transporter MFP subunit
MDLSAVIAKAHIPQADAVLLKIGDKGTITVPGLEKPVEGRITVVSPALDPNSTTVEIWLEAKNPKHLLKPGTSAQLALTAKTVKDALVVPAAAVLTAADGTSAVMVAGSDGKAHQKAVKLGIRQEDDVQILDGVTESDKVVSTGAYGLPDNTNITIEAPSEKESPKEGEKEPAGEKEPSGEKKPSSDK